jgi:hypothetical protein
MPAASAPLLRVLPGETEVVLRVLSNHGDPRFVGLAAVCFYAAHAGNDGEVEGRAEEGEGWEEADFL